MRSDGLGGWAGHGDGSDGGSQGATPITHAGMKDDLDEDNSNEDQPDNGTDKLEMTPEELLLLVNAANGFKNLSMYGMLWTIRHRYTNLSRFDFNCYRHNIILVCR